MNQHEETLSKVRELVKSNDETNVRLAYITFVQSGIITFYEMVTCMIADKYGISIDDSFYLNAGGYWGRNPLTLFFSDNSLKRTGMYYINKEGITSTVIDKEVCKLLGWSYYEFKNNNNELLNRINNFVLVLFYIEMIQNNINEIEKKFCECLNLDYEPRI